MEEKELDFFPFWEYLSADEKKEIMQTSRKVIFEKNQIIASTEMDCLGVFYVLSGLVRVYLYSEDGREVTIARIGEDEMCMMAASCMVPQISFSVQVAAESRVEAVLIPVSVIRKIKEKNVYVENYIYKQTTERFSDVISAVEQMLFMTLEQRVSAFLIDESARTGNSTLDITQEKVAQAIGSAREAVSRILKQLSAAGCVEVSRGKIRILDKKKLYSKM